MRPIKRFARSAPEFAFENEDILQQAIAGLLNRIPGTQDVQVLQGRQERGKDIVFSATGPLGERVSCACVVKNSPISGTAGHNRNLRTLVDQVQQAFEEPFADALGPQRIQCVYVMSPLQISQDAILSVQERLVGQRGQIRFKTGHALFQLFTRYWPDYLKDEASALSNLEVNIEVLSGARTTLRQLAISSNTSAPQDKANYPYVAPSFHRELVEYELPEPGSPLVDPKRLEAEWTPGSVEQLQQRCADLPRLIQHLSDWPLPGWTFESDHDLNRRLARFADRLEEAFLRAARPRGGKVARDLSYIPPSATRTLQPDDAVALNDAAHGLNGALRTTFQTLRDAVRFLNKGIRSLQHKGAPSDAQFHRICAVADCLAAAPQKLLTERRRVLIRLDSERVRRSTVPLLIVGAPGTGKTSFCYRSALSDAKRFSVDRRGRLPVYVPLHLVKHTAGTSIVEILMRTAGVSGILPRPSPRSARLCLYLDGLDEIPSPTTRADLLARIQQERERMVGAQTILTARDYLYERHLHWATRISLGGLNKGALVELANQWLDRDKKKVALFRQSLRKVPALAEVLRIPLLATVTLLVFRQTGRLPENRARLYMTFVSLLCGGWDLAKGINRGTRFPIQSKLSLLAAIAADLHRHKRQDLSEAEFELLALRTFRRGRARPPAALLDEIVADGMLRRDLDRLYFPHLSFQEFLAAKHMLGDPSGSLAGQALDSFLRGDDWWREVLFFYMLLAENPTHVARWIEERGRRLAELTRSQVLIHVLRQSFPDQDLRGDSFPVPE